MEIFLIRTPYGLVPATDDDRDALAPITLGSHVKAKITRERNAKFFRKWWALAKIAFDIWSETMPTMEYKGQRVLPDFDRFRKDLTILAGFYRPVFNARGECRLEAESLAFGRMTEERFDKLYSATVDAVLQKVLPKSVLTEDELNAAVEQMVGFF